MFGKEGTVERIFPPRKSYSLQRGRPQIQQNAPKLFQAWSESDRSLCAAVTPERVTSASSAQFGMILAADGSPCLSRQLQDAEIAETWPLLPAPQRGSAGSWPVPHSSGVLRNKSCLWTFLLHIPCTKEKVCSEPVGQDFLSGAADLVVPVRQLGCSTFPADLG